jgi:histidyl-tRNA synthetase
MKDLYNKGLDTPTIVGERASYKKFRDIFKGKIIQRLDINEAAKTMLKKYGGSEHVGKVLEKRLQLAKGTGKASSFWAGIIPVDGCVSGVY